MADTAAEVAVSRRPVTRLELAAGRVLTVLVVAAAAVWLAALL